MSSKKNIPVTETAPQDPTVVSQLEPVDTSLVMLDDLPTEKPFFTLEDLRTTEQPLAKLLRMLFIKQGVTMEKYKQYYTRAADEVNMDSNTRNYTRNNLKREILNDNITWNTIAKWMVVSRIELVDLTLTYRDSDTQEIKEVKLSEIQQVVNSDAVDDYKVPLVKTTKAFDDLIRKSYAYEREDD